MNDKTRAECEQVARHLAEALGAPPGGQDDRELQAHLAACGRCRRYASRLRLLTRTLDGDPVPDPGERYWEQFAGRVQQRIEARPRRSWPVWAGLTAAAALVLLLMRPPAPPAGTDPPVSAAKPSAVATEEPVEDLRHLLDDLLGPVNGLDLSGEGWDSTEWDLTSEEQRSLLENLRAELKNPA